VLALHASSAIAAGDYPYRGIFYNGGFFETPLFDTLTLGAYQGPFVLRGYSPLKFGGNQYHLFNAEYRFPVVNIDRGLSTVPAFLQRISGNVFADYGGAFNEVPSREWIDQLHLGVGAEIWFDVMLGYVLSATIRVGHARGTDSNRVDGGQTYLVVSSPF
jgi:hypothetical protein